MFVTMVGRHVEEWQLLTLNMVFELEQAQQDVCLYTQTQKVFCIESNLVSML